jgi:hypothetical protein
MAVEVFFDIYQRHQSKYPLALNIKADGLQTELKRLLDAFNIENYFTFDMSVPDGIIYCRRGFRTYTRQSEYEPVPPYYELASGIWLDEFDGHWITDDVINRHLELGKSICIVSPDLHKRDFRREWEHYKHLESKIGKDRLMLCTDFPEKAQEFFNV